TTRRSGSTSATTTAYAPRPRNSPASSRPMATTSASTSGRAPTTANTGTRTLPSTCGSTPTPATSDHRRMQGKSVTVLFCDVTGSTELGESIDPEALRDLLARYFERMKTIVERHGGTVEKFIGDAVMAVFGVPTAHEDDALR